MTDKKTELINRFNIVALEFAAKLRVETTKAGLGEIPKPIIEYLFRKLNPVLEDIADKLAYKAESWLKSRARKFKKWLRRRF